MSGRCDVDLEISKLINLRVTCSNLSGPFFLFDPLSDVGFLIARIFGHIPYLLVGGTWAPGGKYEGTCA
jgi:hypothetical protein